MVTFNSQTAILIYKGGLNDKIQPVSKNFSLKNDNNNKRSFNEQKKNDVKATASHITNTQTRKELGKN
jgi:hypothetical protein